MDSSEIFGLNINLVELSAFIGAFVLPWIQSILQQDRFTAPVNTVIRVLVAIVAAVVLAGANSDLDPNDIVASFVVVITASQAFYAQLLSSKTTGIGPALQSATSIGAGRPYRGEE